MKMNKMLCLCLLLSFIIITEEHHVYYSQQSKHSFNKRHHTPKHEHKKDVINKSHNQNVLNVNNYPKYTNKTEPHHSRFQRNEMKDGHKRRYSGRMFNFKFYKRINNLMSFMYSIVSMVLIGIIALVLLSIAIRMYNNWFLNYQRRQFEKYQFICQQYSDQRNICNNIVTNNNNNLDINNVNQKVHYIYHSGLSVQTQNINSDNH